MLIWRKMQSFSERVEIVRRGQRGMLVCMWSWLESANENTGFGLAHLPYGAFQAENGPRLCVAVGDSVLDLCALSGEFSGPISVALRAPVLNPLLELGTRAWREVRTRLQLLLQDAAWEKRVREALRERSELTMLYPLSTRGYVDFYASMDHARRVGELFRPENPLLPNYTHVPIAYNGRASSLVVSGTPVRRPWGQQKPAEEGATPAFAATAALDYELELAFVAGYGNLLGEPATVAEASSQIFGVALLNDWSARDVQAWEYQPLGPFLGKSFATSVSPWITPMAALEPYRVAAREREEPLAYLRDQQDQQSGALDLRVEVWLATEKHREPMKLSETNVRELFWTPAQMLAHAASNGCPIETGDVFGSGTISGASRENAGCLLERTSSGRDPLVLANGERRRWLEDGDEVILRAYAERDGLERVALGECAGRVLPAHKAIVPR
jgi:fumarylacetoacetase